VNSDGYSLTGLRTEREESEKDLRAFKEAFDIIRRRVIEASEEFPDRGAQFEKWPGTWATFGALELSISTLEKKIEDLSELAHKVMSGELPNTDKPVKQRFGVIKGDREE
jgi:hypothetical protein